jgi:hypothetical protein
MKSKQFLFVKKPKMVFSVFLLCIFFSIVISSCSKGPAGAPGSTGAPGNIGPKGDTGTANVIYSPWFEPSTYTKDTIFGTYHFYYNQVAPEITQGTLDTSLVITFGKLDGYTSIIWPTDQVAALPIVVTYVEGATTYTDTWSALLTPGNLQIDMVDNGNLYNGISNAHLFRYIIIPGAVAAARPAYGSSSTSSQVDYSKMSYEQICSTFDIPE